MTIFIYEERDVLALGGRATLRYVFVITAKNSGVCNKAQALTAACYSPFAHSYHISKPSPSRITSYNTKMSKKNRKTAAKSSERSMVSGSTYHFDAEGMI